MLGILFRNLPIKPKVYNGLSLSRALCTEAPLEKLKKTSDHNIVQITGTIISPAKDLPSGDKSIIVRTNEDNQNYDKHHVLLLKCDRSSDRSTPLTIGQRVHVFGHLSSKPFTLDDGRMKQRLIIKCHYYLSLGDIDTRSDTKTAFDKDKNSVQIVGKITSDIQNTILYNKYISFEMVYNHMHGVTAITEFFRIIAYDQPVIRQAERLQKSDEVLVKGKISYQRIKSDDGKTQRDGFIKPYSIKRI